MTNPASSGVVPDDELVEFQQAHYILATSSRADDRTRVLKEGDAFAVFDRFGDIQPTGLGEQGLYFDGTRFLSRLELRIGGRRPHLLSSTIGELNDVLAVDLTNPDLAREGTVQLPRGELHIHRSKTIYRGASVERLAISSFSPGVVTTDLTLHFDADFADIFEVRGTRRLRRGTRRPVKLGDGLADLSYEGLDGRVRRTRLVFSPRPTEILPAMARFHLVIDPQQSIVIYVRTECLLDDAPSETPRAPNEFETTFNAVKTRVADLRRRAGRVVSSNQAVNDWLARSEADLNMMISETPYGLYPYAGVPWFSTPFGRDGIITALECLWANPSVAAGVLRFLAATQASADEPHRDARPGKILHEMRGGEMAALDEVPFGRYYGSVDSTPLFLLLAGEYYQRTGDLALVSEIWTNLMAALDWVDTHGDVDGDGFVEYARQSQTGLIQQGWKDSADSVFHQDGHLAKAPIALAEVQAYVYAGRLGLASIARARGDEALANRLAAQAEALRAAFETAFWLPELGTYAIALDGDKRPCRVRSSNAGHVLYAGLAAPERAARVAHTLMMPASFSGWGIRTIAAGEPRYNPMSYHNGSIWPHDNALIAQGLSRYGRRDEILRLFEAMLRASSYFDLHRMPELFCGFPYREGEGPTLYPVACAPQAWAAAAPYLILQACLGMSIDGCRGVVSFVRSELPQSIDELRIEGLEVRRGQRVDLLLERHPHDVGITVLRREGDVRVLVER